MGFAARRIEPRPERGRSPLSLSACLAKTCHGDFHVEVGIERLLDERVEFGIIEAVPPLAEIGGIGRGGCDRLAIPKPQVAGTTLSGSLKSGPTAQLVKHRPSRI